MRTRKTRLPTAAPQHRSTAEFFSAIRLLAGRSRQQFAINLGVSVKTIMEVEEGFIPDGPLILALAKKFLQPDFDASDVTAAFRVLRPSSEELEIRESFAGLHDPSLTEAQRTGIRDGLIVRLVPLAKETARRVAWGLKRPECAEEIWGEPLFDAVLRHDRRPAQFTSYLRGNIKRYAAALIWSSRQSGVDTALRDYGKAVRDAENELPQLLGKTPTEWDIAKYLDVSPRVVEDVMRARSASFAVGSDDFELLTAGAVRSHGSLEDQSESELKDRIAGLPDQQRELVFLHYLEGASVADLADMYEVSEEDVLAELKWAVALLAE